MTLYECTDCGKEHHIFRSCGNRHCPGCQCRKGFEWLHRRMERQVPGHHFMVTFTVPETLRGFIRSNQRVAYSALFYASSETMRKLSKDERHIGGDMPGFFGVRHTWRLETLPLKFPPAGTGQGGVRPQAGFVPVGAKSKNGLQRTLDVYWVVHNFVRPHFTTKQVPAVALGIINKALSWQEILMVRMVMPA